MMRRIVLLSLAVGILASGVALALRLRSIPSRETPSPCTVEPIGEGHFLQFKAKDVPVRRIAWAESEEPGFRYLQVATQNDHQLLFAIPPKGPSTRTELQRLEGIPEAFLRTASLHRVIRLSDSTLLLHFVANELHVEPGLLSCVDPTSGRSLWHRRLDGTRSRFSLTSQGATLVLFGTSPRLTCLRWVPSHATPFAPAIEQLDAPAKDLPVLDALPMKDGTLLASMGLSLYRGSKVDGWQPLHSAAESSLYPRSPNGRIALSGGRVLWQPSPGLLFALDPASPSTSPVPVELPTPSVPLDLQMLRLAGNDPEGTLWFDLQQPERLPTTSPVALTAPEPDTAWNMERSITGSEEEAWKSHLAQPLDRVYGWKPDARQLLTLTWSELLPRIGTPAELRATSLRLLPSQGIATTLEPSPVWWISLSSLLGKAAPVQPK